MGCVRGPSGDIEDRVGLQLHFSATVASVWPFKHGLYMPCELIHNFVLISVLVSTFAGFFFFLGHRGIVHPPSDDGGTERTWFVPNTGLEYISEAISPRQARASWCQLCQLC